MILFHRRNPIILLVFVCLLSLTGCSYLEGLAVEKYLRRVSEIQADSDAALLNLNDSLAALSGSEEQVSLAIEELSAGREAVEKALESIEDLETPADAIAFRSDMIDLYTQGRGVLIELEKAGRYSLDTKPQIEAYESASERFTGAVAAATDTQALLAAVREYESAAESALESLQAAEPPILYFRSHQRLLANLVTLKSGLSEMAGGLEEGDEASIESASGKLESISTDNSRLAAEMRADSEADLRDFNARISEMNLLMEKVRQDQEELRQKFKRD